MLSFVFLAFAVVHTVIWLYGVRCWMQLGRPLTLGLFLFANFLLWYDNLRIGLGRFIGEGDLLYAMTIPAFAWHWTMLPLLVIVAGSIARLAGMGWARNRWVMGAFCVAAVALIPLDLPYALSLLFGAGASLPAVELRPACLADTLRYTTTVSEAQLCTPGTETLRNGPGPLVAIIMNFIMLVVGIVIWFRTGWKWLAIGPGLMFLAAGSGPLWGAYSLPVSNFGEILFTLGVLATIVHFARRRQASSLR
jgi:hypothetical protein